MVEAVQQNANLQFLHRHCLLSPIFSKNSIAHFLSIVNKNPAVQPRKSPAVLPAFCLLFTYTAVKSHGNYQRSRTL